MFPLTIHRPAVLGWGEATPQSPDPRIGLCGERACVRTGGAGSSQACNTTGWEVAAAVANPPEVVDYQFLGLVAVVLAVLTRGSVLPVVAVTAFIALVLLACELSAKWYRNRRPRPAGDAGPATGASDGELNRWMTAVERVLRSTR